jgi:PAS domain-containing protein
LIILGIVAEQDTSGQVRRRTEDLEKELVERRRAEDALRESEEKFRVLAETPPVAPRLSGEKLVYVNPAATRIIGYTEQECLEMKFGTGRMRISRSR